MNTSLDFTTFQILLTVAGVFLAIVASITGGKLWLNQRMQQNLTEKHKGERPTASFATRNKYSEVNFMQYSPVMLKLGFILTLALTVGLMNWTSYDPIIPDELLVIEEVIDIEIVPPRTQEPPPPPPPPPPPTIEEVPDEMITEDDEELEFMDQSIEAESIVDVAPIPEPVKATEVAPPPPPPPPPPADVDEIFKIVEEMPRYPGCEDLGTVAEKKQCADAALMKFIYSNLKYPEVARSNGIKGNVVAKFVVRKDGTISDMEIVRDIGGGCGDAVLRVLNKMQDQDIRWIPGKQRMSPVNVQFMLPVRFTLIET